jgi:hypothetical protein
MNTDLWHISGLQWAVWGGYDIMDGSSVVGTATVVSSSGGASVVEIRDGEGQLVATQTWTLSPWRRAGATTYVADREP